MRCRLLYLHKKTNQGKILILENLHREYVAYVKICVDQMLAYHVYIMPKWAKQDFFDRAENLSSQIEKNARDHAITIVSSWAKAAYSRKMKSVISLLKRDGFLTEDDAKSLYVVGLKLISEPWKFVNQDHIDLYSYLLDTYGGNKPQVRSSIPMILSQMTSSLEDPTDAHHVGDFWIQLSTLTKRSLVCLPLAGSPYVRESSQVGKGIAVRKTKLGRWRFETVDKTEIKIPDLPSDPKMIGVDVGLNVLAATSDGCLYGIGIKKKFDEIYSKLKNVRANRQRQNLKDNSRRLDKLESKLSGFVKTETGRIANKLIRKHPSTIFVVEDLNLSGCKGQKRFAYRALQTNLEKKANIIKINPAYTSQECPSCGYISKKNRSGIKFVCRSCGRRSHADWVGAAGILRRSGNKGIGCNDHPRIVKRILTQRYKERRSLSSGNSCSGPVHFASLPLDQSLTIESESVRLGSGTGSNSIPKFS